MLYSLSYWKRTVKQTINKYVTYAYACKATFLIYLKNNVSRVSYATIELMEQNPSWEAIQETPHFYRT
jgi:hypothetical protein